MNEAEKVLPLLLGGRLLCYGDVGGHQSSLMEM